MSCCPVVLLRRPIGVCIGLHFHHPNCSGSGWGNGTAASTQTQWGNATARWVAASLGVCSQPEGPVTVCCVWPNVLGQRYSVTPRIRSGSDARRQRPLSCVFLCVSGSCYNSSCLTSVQTHDASGERTAAVHVNKTQHYVAIRHALRPTDCVRHIRDAVDVVFTLLCTRAIMHHLFQ